MKRSINFFPTFLIVIFLSILLLIFNKNLKFVTHPLERLASYMQSTSASFFRNLPFISDSDELKKLKAEKLNLLSCLASFEKIKKENEALSDQFQTSYPQPTTLLKADVIGAPSFIPGSSFPEILIIDKGKRDGLKAGMAVVIKDNLVGIISKSSEFLSEVMTLYNPQISFTVKAQNGALGIVKGGSSITIDNILLSDSISKNELVLTRGEAEINGVKVPQNLIVGKIISVEKNPSNLFQKAELQSFLKVVSTTVFVCLQK